MIPPRPPREEKETRRSEMTSAREALLLDDGEEMARDFLKAKAGEEKAAILGLPDLSANPLASTCRQLATPGLYGLPPSVLHADSDAAAAMATALDEAGLWPKMQRVQYLALGLGEYLLRLDAPAAAGRLTVRLVSPADVWAKGTADLPDVPVALGELRLRRVGDELLWCWDVYSIEDVEQPYLRVMTAPWRETEAPRDVTVDVLEKSYDGADYPYRYADGRPFLPWVIHRASDTGKMWNVLDKRGATIGTLNTIAYSTYTGHAALAASGRSVVCVDMAPIGGIQQAPDGSSPTVRSQAVTLMPGSWVFGQRTDPQAQPTIVEVGAGADLQVLSDFLVRYEGAQSIRAGLNPSDATRSHANPTSGAALAITNRGRREFAEQVTPIFRRADLEVIRKAAALLRLGNVAQLPESGWSIVYATIPRSPDEDAEEREALQWEADRGLISQVDLYLRRNPGADRESAFRALAQVAADRRRIEKESADPASLGSGGAVQDSVLSGAQIASLVAVAEAVAGGRLSVESATALIQTAIPGTSAEAAGRIAGDRLAVAAPAPVPVPVPVPTVTPAAGV